MMNDDDKTIDDKTIDDKKGRRGGQAGQQRLAGGQARSHRQGQAPRRDMYAAQVYVQMELIDINTATVELPPADDPAGAGAGAGGGDRRGQARRPERARAALVYSNLLENRRRAMSTRNHESRLSTIEQVNRDRAKSEWRRQ